VGDRKYHNVTEVVATAAASTTATGLGPAQAYGAFRYDLVAVAHSGVPVVALFTLGKTDGNTQAISVYAGPIGAAPTIHEFHGPGITAVTVSAPASCTANIIAWW
jgi:hypothetical protein